jgi:inner membrane protein
MPSSIGHALGALIAGGAVATPPVSARQAVMRVIILSALGAAPDLDLLFGRHRAETHSLGAAVIVGAVAALMHWPLASTRIRIFFTAAAAWSSHMLLDVIGQDHSFPYGVELLWPVSTSYFTTGWEFFLPISRSWYTRRHIPETLTTIRKELTFLLPILIALVAARWPRGGSRQAS